jgi:uncharacterized repeat protein (TIGR01451 family)
MRLRRVPIIVTVAASLAVALRGPVAPALAASQAILSAGPLTRIEISDDLNCAVDHTGDTSPEFFGDTACGTFVAVGGTLFGPVNIPAGGSANPRTAFTPISQSAVLGSGTNADPYRIVTVVGLGLTGLQITETDSYIVGQETYRTDVEISSTSASPTSAILYRAGDCFLQNSDEGFGAADATTGAVSCVAGVDNGSGTIVPGTRIEQWYPLSAGSSYYESDYNSVWAQIGSQAAFANSCEQCATYIDNGAGLSWNVTIPAGGSATRSHLTVFSPLGIEPLTTTKTAAQPSVSAGGSDSYTITIANPNTTAAVLTSITDTLPTGFTYSAGSTTGATTADPSVAGQVLTWNGPFNVPASGSLTLTFGVTASTTPGTYANQAEATAVSPFVVAGTGPTAPVTVTGPTQAHLTLAKSVDNTGGGTALATAWTLSATGPTTISGHSGDASISNAAVDAGTYTLAESGGPTGYTAGAWSCTGGTLTGNSLVLAAGETATCSITNTFVPVVTVGRISPTETTCQQYVAGTAATLPRINYSVSGGEIRQNINPGVFFYFSTVTVSAGDVITTSQSTTNSSGKLFLLNQGHAFVLDSRCTKIGNMASTNGGATGTYTAQTAGTYILQLQYQTKSIAGTAAPSPDNPTYTFDTDINGVEFLPDTTSIGLHRG